MSTSMTSQEILSVNTIRTLSMDAVQQAESGHPGTPMALAPAMYQLWNRRLRYDPQHPAWPARDRFVLSCGHASMLLYSTLHLAGVCRVDARGEPTGELAITLDAIRRFRQLHSPCAGHPEFGEAPGIETTTGPLGQGIGNSVGMALAAKWLSTRYDRPGFPLFGFNVYALCSDGDLMEGVGCEAASLAGHLQLDNLCWIFDDNRITIEGSTDLSISEDTAARFRALGWHVVTVSDANDCDAIDEALRGFSVTAGQPTLILLRSVIAFGAPNKQGTHGAHGSPLGEEEIRLTKQFYDWPADKKFWVPEEVREDFRSGIGRRGQQEYRQWAARWADYQQRYPSEAGELETMWRGELPEAWSEAIPEFPADKSIATRSASGKVLNAVAARVPWWLGGSADLAPSNNTRIEDSPDVLPGEFAGRNLHYGVREHAMGAISNGLALAGLRPYAGTFFVFTDYMRPSIRLACLMRQPVIYILTHDSIGLGEDGPTHQPVEHLAACRAMPNLIVFRPCDANEVAEGYRCLLPMRCPVAMVLTRQNLPVLDRSQVASASGAARGGYVLWESAAEPQVILIGTGSEVQVCLDAARQLAATVAVRVVSMPSWELFERQDSAYRQQVLPPRISARVAVEAGVRQGWDRYIGVSGGFVGLQGFGGSAPYQQLYEHFGITPQAVVQAATSQLATGQ
jgi:transketolase